MTQAIPCPTLLLLATLTGCAAPAPTPARCAETAAECRLSPYCIGVYEDETVVVQDSRCTRRK